MTNRDHDADLARLRASVETLQTINALTDELHRATDQRTLARHAATAMMQYSESPSVSVYLHHAESGELELLHTAKLTDETAAVIGKHPTKGTLSGQAVAAGEVVVCPDMQTEPSITEPLREAARREGIVSAASIPLLFEERALGTLNLVFHGPREFSAAELETLRSIGQTIGLALANVQHVERIEAEIKQRRKAEAELASHRDHLDELVTSRTRALMRALDRAQESDRLKSEFLTTISHELRTPLNSILGFTTTVRDGMAGPLNDEQSRQLGFAQTSAEHLLSLINDLIDLSQIEAGRMELVDEAFDLSEVAAQVVASMKPRADAKGLVIRNNLCPRTCSLVSDRRRVAQVLLNLVDNAIKFTDAGEVCIDCNCDDVRARLKVSDDGVGISPQDQAVLFDPFRQLDGGTDRIHEGSGLGLSICRELVTLLGGTIEVESEPGRGSTFRVILPRRSQKPTT